MRMELHKVNRVGTAGGSNLSRQSVRCELERFFYQTRIPQMCSTVPWFEVGGDFYRARRYVISSRTTTD